MTDELKLADAYYIVVRSLRENIARQSEVASMLEKIADGLSERNTKPTANDTEAKP